MLEVCCVVDPVKKLLKLPKEKHANQNKQVKPLLEQRTAYCLLT